MERAFVRRLRAQLLIEIAAVDGDDEARERDGNSADITLEARAVPAHRADAGDVDRWQAVDRLDRAAIVPGVAPGGIGAPDLSLARVVEIGVRDVQDLLETEERILRLPNTLSNRKLFSTDQYIIEDGQIVVKSRVAMLGKRTRN